MNYYFYILCSQIKEIYYYGSSGDPARRLSYHNHSPKGFPQFYHPWKIVYRYGFDTRQEAEAAKILVI